MIFQKSQLHLETRRNYTELFAEISLYPEISKFLSSDIALESRYVSYMQIMSNLWIAIKGLKRITFSKMWEEIVFRF